MKRLVLVLLAILAPVVAQGQQSTLPLDHGYLGWHSETIMLTSVDDDDSTGIGWQDGAIPFVGGWFWAYAWDEPMTLWVSAAVGDSAYVLRDSIVVPAATPVAHNIRIFNGRIIVKTMDRVSTNAKLSVVVYPHTGSAQAGP